MTTQTAFIIGGIALGVVIVAALSVTYGCKSDWCTIFPWQQSRVPPVASFEECVSANYPVLESYPRQCKTPGGKTFTENIGNALEKQDLIRVTTPRPNQAIVGPLTVTGEARGTWFFEASFSVKLFDGNGKQIAAVPAQAQGEWMTTEFVPFDATLTFTTPTTATGVLVLEKDNPSGLPQNADQLTIPVKLGTISVEGKCVVTGCSGQICAEKETVTTCEYKPEYACYKTAKCERQISGDCGWTQTPALEQCILHARKENSGVKGQILLGPTCPVVREPPDPQCVDKPYQTKVSALQKGTNVVVATTESDTDAMFRLQLPAGTYMITAQGGQTLPRCATQDVTVVQGEFTDVTISCDTGIR